MAHRKIKKGNPRFVRIYQDDKERKLSVFSKELECSMRYEYNKKKGKYTKYYWEWILSAVERSKSDRARCRGCRKRIGKNTLRGIYEYIYRGHIEELCGE